PGVPLVGGLLHHGVLAEEVADEHLSRRVHLDVRVELNGGVHRKRNRAAEALPAVVGNLNDDRVDGTSRAPRNPGEVRREHVDVPEAIGGYRGLPVVSRWRKSHDRWRRETGAARRGADDREACESDPHCEPTEPERDLPHQNPSAAGTRAMT